MMFGLMRVRTHDAEMAKVRAERDQANTDKRTIGAALHEMLRERNALQARLDALTPARREDGRFVAKARRLQPASPPPNATGYGYGDH